MLLMIFFVGILFPGILQFGIDSLNQNAFTKNTKEFTELVQEEAGLTAKSKEVKARLEGKGYAVQLTDQKGHTVTGTVPYGDTIHLAYEYTFKSVFKERVLKSTNTALVTKRDEKTSTGGGVPVKPGGEEQAQGKVQTKTVSLLSNESKNATQTQTFTIDNLGKVKRISSDTGNVEIQSINGNEVTVKMTGGATSRQVQTGGEYVEGESKYVTNQMNQIYKDQDGFEGVLNKYVSSGYLMQGREKYVTAQYGKFYRDAEGYEGDLAAYLYSGELKPGGSKYVTGQTSSNYSDSQGYSGNLERYVHSGSYQAADEKIITDAVSKTSNKKAITDSEFASTITYSKDGYTGVLKRTSITSDNRIVNDSSSGWRNNSDSKNNLINVSSIKDVNKTTIESYLGHPIISFKLVWSGDILGPGAYEGPDGKLNKYARYFDVHYTYHEYNAKAFYEGWVKRSAQDTRVYRYQGTVNKPSVDTRVYRYQGVVKQPDTDMREWRYQGTVRKQGMDTRTFDKYYQYNLELTYEVKE